MKYEIYVSDRKTYVHVRINEAVTPELLADFIGAAAKKSSECGIDNFLFDLRSAHNETSLYKHYEIVYKDSKDLGFKLRSKHALVVSRENMADYDFVETILVNAGYQGKIFTEELSAIEWLEK